MKIILEDGDLTGSRIGSGDRVATSIANKIDFIRFYAYYYYTLY